jgi:ribonuclease P protein component
LALYALPQQHLLRANKEFERVYRSGRRLKGDAFAVILLANSLTHHRLGISIPKKVGNAVRRNRIKRLIRELFRLHRTVFPVATDVVFAVRPGFAIDSLSDLQSSVTRTIAPHTRKNG